MRFAVIALSLTIALAGGGSAAASLAAHSAGFHAFATSLPDPATTALLFAGLGLVAGARRSRSKAVAD